MMTHNIQGKLELHQALLSETGQTQHVLWHAKNEQLAI